MPRHSPFRYFKTSPEIIRLAVMLYIRFPLSLRNVKDLSHERGICNPRTAVHNCPLGCDPNIINGLRVEKVRRQSRPLRQFT